MQFLLCLLLSCRIIQAMPHLRLNYVPHMSPTPTPKHTPHPTPHPSAKPLPHPLPKPSPANSPKTTTHAPAPTGTLKSGTIPFGGGSNNGMSGNYTVPGLGVRKAAVTAAGGNDLALAVGMLETDHMQASSYPYGDNKTQDAANFGIFKQNWAMLRQCCNTFKGQSEAQWNNGARLNADLNADVSCLNQCQRFYGLSAWYGGHRDGATGIANPNLPTVQQYKTGVQWIQNQVDTQPGAKTDDTRYYYKVPAI